MDYYERPCKRLFINDRVMSTILALESRFDKFMLLLVLPSLTFSRRQRLKYSYQPSTFTWRRISTVVTKAIQFDSTATECSPLPLNLPSTPTWKLSLRTSLSLLFLIEFLITVFSVNTIFNLNWMLDEPNWNWYSLTMFFHLFWAMGESSIALLSH